MIFDRTNPGQPMIAGDFQIGDLIKLEWGFPIEVESIEDSGEAGFTTILATDGVRHIFDSSKSYQVLRMEPSTDSSIFKPGYEAAINPETASGVLEGLASSLDPTVRRAALLNPSMPQHMLENLSITGTLSDVMAIGSNPAASDHVRTICELQYAELLIPSARRNRLIALKAKLQSNS